MFVDSKKNHMKTFGSINIVPFSEDIFMYQRSVVNEARKLFN